MTEKTITFQNSVIFYRTIGEGKTVVLIHGFAEDGSIWDAQVEFLKNDHYLIIPDLPGSGKSGMINTPLSEEKGLGVRSEKDIGMEDYAGCIKQILVEEKIDHCTMIGHSMGGYITLAFAEKYRGTKNVVLCFFGDGAARQGMLHETFNMAMLWDLPVVFICENNNYAMGTSVARTSKVLDIYKLADAYDMPGDSVDGMSPEDVHNGVLRAVNRAREKGGPTLLEIKTYRYKGHSMSDPQKYRSKDEVEEYKERDPIDHVLKILKEEYRVEDADIELMNNRVKQQVDDAVSFAEESPWPDDNELLKDVYVQADYPFITD